MPVAAPPTPSSSSSLAGGRRLLLGILPMSTGAALVTLIVARISMPLAALTVAGIGITARRFVLRELDPIARARVMQLTKRAVGAGIAATLAYDATRFGIVALADWNIRPFYAIPRFGQQFVGTGGSQAVQWAVGLTYHVLNGVGFAVAYALVVRRPRWGTAVAWALVLEAAMVLMYPQWLGINISKEFTVISLSGHLAWGSALYAVLHSTEPKVGAPS